MYLKYTRVYSRWNVSEIYLSIFQVECIWNILEYIPGGMYLKYTRVYSRWNVFEIYLSIFQVECIWNILVYIPGGINLNITRVYSRWKVSEIYLSIFQVRYFIKYIPGTNFGLPSPINTGRAYSRYKWISAYSGYKII